MALIISHIGGNEAQGFFVFGGRDRRLFQCNILHLSGKSSTNNSPLHTRHNTKQFVKIQEYFEAQ